MPRPQKKRHVCQMPLHHQFGPYNESAHVLETVILTVDELETIRLMDYEGYDQEDAAEQMQVARTTVQRIYNEARKKIADALVSGKQIYIEGGEVVVCDKDCDRCVHPNRLRKHQFVNTEEKHE